MTMTVERTRCGVRIVRDGRVGLFWAPCAEFVGVDAACSWMLSPDYTTGGWRVKHGERVTDGEGRLDIPPGAIPEPFGQRLMDTIVDWLDRVHIHEGTL